MNACDHIKRGTKDSAGCGKLQEDCEEATSGVRRLKVSPVAFGQEEMSERSGQHRWPENFYQVPVQETGDCRALSEHCRSDGVGGSAQHEGQTRTASRFPRIGHADPRVVLCWFWGSGGRRDAHSEREEDVTGIRCVMGTRRHNDPV